MTSIRETATAQIFTRISLESYVCMRVTTVPENVYVNGSVPSLYLYV